MSTLIRHPHVIADVVACAAFVGQDDPRVADRFIAATEAAFATLVGFPGLGSPMEPFRPWMASLRAFPIPKFEDYLIIYRERDDLIEIGNVVCGSRDLTRLPRRFR